MSAPVPTRNGGFSGVWMAHYADWSAFVPFREEVNALRHAVEHAMVVTFCPYGQDPREVFDPRPRPSATRGQST